MSSDKKLYVTYPQLGNYDIAISHFVRNGVGIGYMAPPPMTKRTIDIGAKNSPDFACAPFKCMMGCYIEALEKGANVLAQTGGTCRLGYYGELHEQILRDLGYEFQMLDLNLEKQSGPIDMLKLIKELTPGASMIKMLMSLPATAKMITSIDKVEDYYRQNMGFEITDGDFKATADTFYRSLRKAKGLGDINRAFDKCMADFKAIPTNKPANPVRVGVIGEYFTIMDPYSNHEVEEKLAKMGAEVHRWMNLSNSVLVCPDERVLKKLKGYIKYDLHKFPSSIWVDSQKEEASKYVKYDMGASSVATITLGEHYAKKGCDGIVHIKSFGCTPEMDAVPVLHNISADYKVPMLFLSYDTQTSDTGIETRLEAFYDMIAMKSHKGQF